MNSRASFLLALAVSLLALTWQLGTRGLNEPDEGRYASVAYEMLRSGDWLTPRFQGEPHLTKPPLAYWAMAASMKAFGVNEWSVRLPPALAALGTILLTWSLAYRWMGAREALNAALILLTAPLFFVVGRVADPNMLLTFWVTLGIWSWVRWREDGAPAARWIYHAAHGLAFLTKGPVGCILILLAQLAFALTGERPATQRGRIASLPGILLALAIGLPWYLLVIAVDAGRFEYFWRYELLDRLFTNVHKRTEPFWFFFAVLPAAMLPWLPLFARVFRTRWRDLRALRPDGGLALFVLLVLAFFTVSRSKLPTYILPALPPLAILAASCVRRDGNAGRKFVWSMRLVGALALLTPVALLVVGEANARASHWIHGSTAAAAVLLAMLLWRLCRGPTRQWVVTAALLLLTTYASMLDTYRRHQRTWAGESTAVLVRDWRHAAPDPMPRVYYTHAPAGLPFYLRLTNALPRLALAKGDGKLTSEGYVAQLREHLERLRGESAFVVCNAYHLDQAADAARDLPAEPVTRDRKYVILRSR